MVRDPLQALRRSEVVAAHQYREEQQKAASKEVVKAAVAVVPNLAIYFLSEWGGDLTGVDTKSFSKLAKEYVLAMLGQETVEQAVDTSFEQLTEPAVERAATILSNGLNKRWTHFGPPDSPETRPEHPVCNR